MVDKFYTKIDIARECIEHVNPYITPDSVIIEPSAGNGSFIEALHTLHTAQKIYIDIAPEHPDIQQGDFLKLQFPNDSICIGNPPFGKQSSLAKKFIKHACSFSRVIAFILPKSFKKESMTTCFDRFFHLTFQHDLPKNSFFVPGKAESYDVPCIFQIWIKKDHKRDVEPRMQPIGWEFVSKDDSPTCSFRRVGGTAGTLSLDFKEKSTQSHYFIRFKTLDDFYKIQGISWETNNTVGPRSISKQEIIRKFNERIA